MGLKAEEESQRVPDLVPVQVHWEQHSEIALCLCFPSSDSTEEEHYFLVQWVFGVLENKGRWSATSPVGINWGCFPALPGALPFP